ncbi:uncharacterized protein L201_007632 [Kwoniella dendrophila CBS 6074]|uniref:Zinc finger protein 830 n=1 Tax=Kwoniella dendrophila CBS 6074 TaxID=1295534 RepID=A0AAX4K6E9_9TREE
MDAKSLLRAKKAEARINHPYAAYNSAGVLRCSICAVPVKQWDAHLLTKQHRTSVQREKAEQQKLAQAKLKSNSKRSLPVEASANNGQSPKRSKIIQKEENDDDDDDDEEGAGTGGLPAGFFSSGNRPKSPSPSPEPETTAGPSIPSKTVPPEPTGDSELDDFLSSLNNDDTAPTVISTTATKQQQSKGGIRKTYKEIIPSQTAYEAAPVKIIQPDQQQQTEEPEEEEESEQERKERLEREEREEIVRRLEDEERAQEDADSRVASLKARMEMLKKRREAKLGKSIPKDKSTTDTNGA